MINLFVYSVVGTLMVMLLHLEEDKLEQFKNLILFWLLIVLIVGTGWGTTELIRLTLSFF